MGMRLVSLRKGINSHLAKIPVKSVNVKKLCSFIGCFFKLMVLFLKIPKVCIRTHMHLCLSYLFH